MTILILAQVSANVSGNITYVVNEPKKNSDTQSMAAVYIVINMLKRLVLTLGFGRHAEKGEREKKLQKKKNGYRERRKRK